MSKRGFTQWLVQRMDLGAADAGSYHTQASTIVFADSMMEALQVGADELNVDQAVLSATQVYSGFGVGEEG